MQGAGKKDNNYCLILLFADLVLYIQCKYVPRIWLWMIGGLLDELEKELIDQAILLHGLVQDGLDEEDVVLLLTTCVDVV